MSDDREPAGDESEEHEGTFASGQSDPETFPDEEQVGTYASGESDPRPTPKRSTWGPSPQASQTPRPTPKRSRWGALAKGRRPQKTDGYSTHPGVEIVPGVRLFHARASADRDSCSSQRS